MQQVKLLIVEWLLELFRAFCIKLLYIKSSLEVDEYSRINESVDLRNMPSFFKKTLIYNQDIINERWEICKSCEFFTESNTCSICKCMMKTKVKFSVASCPKNKWGKYKGDIGGITITN